MKVCHEKHPIIAYSESDCMICEMVDRFERRIIGLETDKLSLRVTIDNLQEEKAAALSLVVDVANKKWLE